VTSCRTALRISPSACTLLLQFYVALACKDLGALWEWLPEGAMYHDPNAYLKSEMAMQDSILRSDTSDLRH